MWVYLVPIGGGSALGVAALIFFVAVILDGGFKGPSPEERRAADTAMALRVVPSSVAADCRVEQHVSEASNAVPHYEGECEGPNVAALDLEKVRFFWFPSGTGYHDYKHPNGQLRTQWCRSSEYESTLETISQSMYFTHIRCPDPDMGVTYRSGHFTVGYWGPGARDFADLVPGPQYGGAG